MAFTLSSSESLSLAPSGNSYIDVLNNETLPIMVKNANWHNKVFVIGIEGAVGAGKTGLLNYLEQIPPQKNTTIIYQREDVERWMNYPTNYLPGTFSKPTTNLLECNAFNRQVGIYENMAKNMSRSIEVLETIDKQQQKGSIPEHVSVLIVERGTEGSTFLTKLDERNEVLTKDEMNSLIDQQNNTFVPSDRKILLQVPLEESIKKANDSVSKERIEDIWAHYNDDSQDYIQRCTIIKWCENKQIKFDKVKQVINRFINEFRENKEGKQKKQPELPWCDISDC